MGSEDVFPLVQIQISFSGNLPGVHGKGGEGKCHYELRNTIDSSTKARNSENVAL